jgi:antitoxin (DNA-binding transcriptional repressor) of toxin-antitoxin stability system
MHQKRITKSQFKAQALEYLRNIETTGEALVITDRGNPVVELRPFRPYKRCPLEVLWGSVIEYRDPFGPATEEDWEINKGG